MFTKDQSGRVELALFSNRKVRNSVVKALMKGKSKNKLCSIQFYGRQQGDDDDTDVCSHVLREGGFKHFIVSDKANGESAQVFFFSHFKNCERIVSSFVVVAVVVGRFRCCRTARRS